MKNSLATKTQRTKRGILIVALLFVVCAVVALLFACGRGKGGATYSLSVSDDFKSQYYVGESFVAGGTLTIKHSDGREESYPITADMVLGFDTSVADQVIVRITYGDYSTSYPIQVLAMTAATMELDQDTLPAVIYQNAAFPDGVTMSVNLSDGTTETVSVTSSMLANFDSSAIGKQNVSVTYLGKTLSFIVTIKQDVKTSISLLSAKTQYEVGDPLSTTGTSVAVLYESGKVTKVPFSADLLSGFSTELGGEFVATVTCESLTCEYRYIVNKVALSLELEEDTLPDLYEIGDPFPTGGYALLTYNDGTTQRVSLTSSDNAAAFTTETSGEKCVQIVHSGVSDEYTYTVLPAIESATPFGFTRVVLQGSEFDGFGELIVEYESGESETIDFSSSRLTIVKFDTETLGTVEQILRFRTREIPFSVVVYSEEERDSVERIELSGVIPPVKFGDPIDPSNLQVTIIYTYLDSATVYCKSEWISAELPEEIEGDYQDLLVTVTYKGASEETQVRVLSEEYAATVTALRKEGVWQSLYLVGDELSLEDACLTAIYGDGYAVKQSIPLLAEYVEDFDTSTAGEKTMTVRYDGAFFTVNYRVIDEDEAERVTSVALNGFDPLLFVGDTMEDLLKEGDPVPNVSLTYGYGYRSDWVPLELSMLSGTLGEGRCELTLTYQDVTAPVYVTVHAAQEKNMITSIQAPAIVQATLGSQPDFSAYTIGLVYGYGYEIRSIPMTTSGITVSEFSATKQGLQLISITYSTQEKTFTCSTFISFAYGSGENVLSRIEVTAGAEKVFTVDEELGEDVKIRVYYLSGTHEDITVTAEMIEGFSTKNVGVYETTIIYGDKSAPYAYTVVEPEEQEPEEDPEEQQQV